MRSRALSDGRRLPNEKAPRNEKATRNGTAPRNRKGPRNRKAPRNANRRLKPKVGKGKPRGGNGEQAHRAARRPPALGRTARVEDLKAILPLFVEGEVAVAEDDGVR